MSSRVAAHVIQHAQNNLADAADCMVCSLVDLLKRCYDDAAESFADEHVYNIGNDLWVEIGTTLGLRDA